MALVVMMTTTMTTMMMMLVASFTSGATTKKVLQSVMVRITLGPKPNSRSIRRMATAIRSAANKMNMMIHMVASFTSGATTKKVLQSVMVRITLGPKPNSTACTKWATALRIAANLLLPQVASFTSGATTKMVLESAMVTLTLGPEP